MKDEYSDYPLISSLSFLLRVYSVPLTPQQANKIFLDKGILLELHRPSLIKGDPHRSFYVLSRKGLKYGSNLKNPVHPMETKVHYCINAFQCLADILTEETKKDAN